MNAPIAEKDILQVFSGLDLAPDARQYLHVHSRRYAYLLHTVSQARRRLPRGQANIMDIGPSFFTRILRDAFPGDRIYTLGLDDEASRGGHYPTEVTWNIDRFFPFDLNQAQHREKWITPPACGIVVMAEVLEHLYTAPTLVLRFIQSFLELGGYCIIQTPNAAALSKRIRLLLGKHPYEMIRENHRNPGHFREYTMKELKLIARKTGYSVERSECKNYFKARFGIEKLYIALNNLLPPSFRDGITMVLRNRLPEANSTH